MYKDNDFLRNFAAEFTDTPASLFSLETKYRELGEWDSLMSLTIIAMVDEKYGVRITGNELRACETVGQLHELIFKLK